MERLQMMIKESENRFDEISAALVQIMSENIPSEENYRHSTFKFKNSTIVIKFYYDLTFFCI